MLHEPLQFIELLFDFGLVHVWNQFLDFLKMANVVHGLIYLLLKH